MLSFRNRLLILLLGLVAGAQIVTLFTALARTATEERKRADVQLVRGAQTAVQTLADRERLLATAVSVLVADFGLREAVAIGDAPTLASALDNHALRIGADVSFALDLDGEVIGRGRRTPDDLAALVAAMGRAQGPIRQGAQFVSAGSGIYQVFSAPVMAPDEVGSVVLGFPVDAALADTVRKQVDVEVAFVLGTTEGFRISSATGAPGHAGAATMLPPLRASPTRVLLGGEEYLATATHLSGSDPSLDVALLKPMGEVMAPFRRLALQLGLIFGVTLAIAIAAGIYLGRSAARPVQRMACGAARIAAGDYTREMEGGGGREFAELAVAFNSMQAGIAERESRLMHMALHDAGTGLPNRRRLIEWLDVALDAGRGPGLVVVQCAVTNLREVSASLGFHMADRLVAHVASRLAEAAGEAGMVARLGGAEFAVAAPADDEVPASELAARIRACCAQPLVTEGITLRATVVLGIAAAPADATGAGEILRCAHAAAEAAMAAGHPVAHFANASDEAQRRRLKLGADLPRALQDGQLHLLYQPKRNLATGRIGGVEALVRWRHPVFGDVSPVEFVPIAERTGASAPLTRWVLGTALGQLRQWHAQGIRIGMAVNLSAADLTDQQLLQDILGVLLDTRLPAGSLTLEITESVLLQDAHTVRGNIQLLRVAGVRISIDDFGTGYSSLSQLRELDADELKIDQSFVRGALRSAGDEAMLRAIVQMARGMGLATVAEGIEHESQEQMLRELGCDQAQGYLVSRPAAPSELAPLLRETGVRRFESGVTALRTQRQRESG